MLVPFYQRGVYRGCLTEISIEGPNFLPKLHTVPKFPYTIVCVCLPLFFSILNHSCSSSSIQFSIFFFYSSCYLLVPCLLFIVFLSLLLVRDNILLLVCNSSISSKRIQKRKHNSGKRQCVWAQHREKHNWVKTWVECHLEC